MESMGQVSKTPSSIVSKFKYTILFNKIQRMLFGIFVCGVQQKIRINEACHQESINASST